jgi:hypothetical protein
LIELVPWWHRLDFCRGRVLPVAVACNVLEYFASRVGFDRLGVRQALGAFITILVSENPTFFQLVETARRFLAAEPVRRDDPPIFALVAQIPF